MVDSNKNRFIGSVENDGKYTLYFCWVPVYRSIFRSTYKTGDGINKIQYQKKSVLGVPVYSENIEDYVRTRKILGLSFSEHLALDRITDLIKLQEQGLNNSSRELKEQLDYLSNRVTGIESSLLSRIEKCDSSYQSLVKLNSESSDTLCRYFKEIKDNVDRSVGELSKSVADSRKESVLSGQKTIEELGRKVHSCFAEMNDKLKGINKTVKNSSDMAYADILKAFEIKFKAVLDYLSDSVLGTELKLLKKVEEYNSNCLSFSKQGSESFEKITRGVTELQEVLERSVDELSGSIVDSKVQLDDLHRNHSSDMEDLKNKLNSGLSQVKSVLDNVNSGRESVYKDLVSLFEEKVQQITSEYCKNTEDISAAVRDLVTMVDDARKQIGDSSKSSSEAFLKVGDELVRTKKLLNSVFEDTVRKMSDELRFGLRGVKKACSDRIQTGMSSIDKKICSVNNQSDSLHKSLDGISDRISSLQSWCASELHNASTTCIDRIKSLESTCGEYIEQHKEADAEVKKISDRIDEINVESLNKSNDMIVNVIAKRVNDSVGVARENEWAAIFNNTIYNSSWLNDRSFSPGRWAVGYQFLYVMYRILNEVKPKSILELGLGQSTRMIAQYVRASSDVNHYVVEHDPGWIEFFSNNFAVPESTTIVQLPWDFRPYKEAERVRCYKDFAANFKDKVFDFISIDGPLGGDMHQYARIDTLSIVPESLAENFVIMIDDTERSGEIGMIAELLAKLDAAGIKYKVGRYRGEKQATVICSLAWGFLSSM